MNYEEALEWLYATQLFGIKPGLEPIRRLLDALGSPDRSLTIAHVAGTNGKGSTCAMMEAMVRKKGGKTGLFTSPHLIAFPERIRVNGKTIPKEDAAAGITQIRDLIKDWDPHPTFFEITTALALQHFANHRCEFVALETGMGGRLDATNVVSPCVSVITSISLDHQKWLGDTLDRIAAEKAGIMKRGIPVLSPPQDAVVAEVLELHADKLGAPFEFIDDVYDGALSLKGRHQQINAALAIAALRTAQIPHDTSALAKVIWGARFQQIGRIVIDGAHNRASVAALILTWKAAHPNEKATILMGALEGKSLETQLKDLSEIASKFLFTPVNSKRTLDPEELEKALHQAVPAEQVDNLRDGLAKARQHDELILITGSLYLAGEALALLEEHPEDFEMSDQ